MNIKYKEWVHHLLLSRKLWLENLIEEGLK